MEFLTDYLLMFMLGSYTVATMDDLKKMRASVSFVYLWALVAVVSGIVFFMADQTQLVPRAITIIVTFVLMRTGVVPFFRSKVAWGDWFAVLPLIFLFDPVWFAVFFLLMTLFDKVFLKLVYVHLLNRRVYPFMPAITIPLAMITIPKIMGLI